jgi:capsular exopolysaccharide synthesis family protein
MPPPSASAARPPSKPAAARATATTDLRQPLIVLRAHFLVSAALALVVCTLVAWQQLRRPRLYAADAALVVERTERLELGERGEFGLSEVATLTRLEQLRSPELLQRVLASLTPDERVLLGVDAADAAPADRERLLRAAVRGAIDFTRKEGTSLIVISAVHGDPRAAALLANRYAEQAIRYAFERSSASNGASLAFLRDQAEDIRKKAEAAERQLQEYRQKFNLVSLEANQNIIVDNLKSLNASATAARVARVAIEARLAQAEAVIKRGDAAEQFAGLTTIDGLTDVTRRLADLRAKRAVMAERYGRRHPAMQENEHAIEALTALRNEQIGHELVTLRDQRDKAEAEGRQLAAQLAAAEKAALDLDQLGVEYNILRRAVDSHKASYSQILARLNDAAVASQLRGVNMRISELATPPVAPFSPNPRKIALLTVALAVIILLGYPFSAELFFGRIRSALDVDYHLGTDVLGEIGSVRTLKESVRPTLVKTDHDETATEQFSALFSQLSLSSKIDPPKSILVTSTLPGEGKSFIAANLAQCFVAHSKRTLLIDADLRRPAQHRQFGLDNNLGLLRWLDGGAAPEGDLLRDEKLGIVEVFPGLHLLRAGGINRKASELMDAERLPQLFAALQRRFDVMIFDTPPAGVFPDALGFAKACHEFIYICRFNTASRQEVRGVLQRLRQTGLDFPGIVLNAMPTGFAGNYYYQSYGYQRTKHYAKHYAKPKA